MSARSGFDPSPANRFAASLPVLMLVAVLAGSLPGPGRCLAASGDLDPSFGTDGVVFTTFGGSYATALTRQSDGKLIAAGATTDASGGAIAVARFDADGTPDPSFGAGGMVTTKVGLFDDWVVKVLVQSDDKIVVVGGTEVVDDGSDNDVVLVRYDSDGLLDTGYGTGGIVVVSLGSGTDTARSAALQADDAVIVVGGGTSTMTTSADLFVARFDTGGALDGTFGTGGVATLDFGGRGDEGTGVAVQPDGYIVVTGSSFNGPLFLDGAVASLSRLDPTGAPDPGFGTAGSVVVNVDTINLFEALLRQPDGQLVVLGATGPAGVSHHLFRFDDTGTPDPGFTPDPIPVFLQVVTPDTLALQGDGKFVVVGGSGSGFEVARFDSNGSLDQGFAIDGSIAVAVGISGAARAVLIQPAGGIVMAGGAKPPDSSDEEFGLARLEGSSPACTSDADCGVCERCGAGSSCEIGERSGCTSAAPGKARLMFRREDGGGDRLRFQWRGSVPTFDPTTSDDVGVCMYDAGRRILKAVAPAGGTCDALPCWTGSGSDFGYDDSDRTPDGIRHISIASDRLKVLADGNELTTSPQGLPSPPFLAIPGPPVLVQVHAGNGACIEASFDSHRRVTGTRFAARSD